MMRERGSYQKAVKEGGSDEKKKTVRLGEWRREAVERGEWKRVEWRGGGLFVWEFLYCVIIAIKCKDRIGPRFIWLLGWWVILTQPGIYYYLYGVIKYLVLNNNNRTNTQFEISNTWVAHFALFFFWISPLCPLAECRCSLLPTDTTTTLHVPCFGFYRIIIIIIIITLLPLPSSLYWKCQMWHIMKWSG